MNTSQTAAERQILSPLERLKVQSEQAMKQAENTTLREALAISNDKCNSLIDKQNMLIKDLTTKVSELETSNANEQKKSRLTMIAAVEEIKDLQTEVRVLNKAVAMEASQTIKETITSLESEIRQTIQTQSAEVFAEVKKELDESKKLLSATREELKLQGKFRKVMFWATPVLLFLQVALTAFLLLK